MAVSNYKLQLPKPQIHSPKQLPIFREFTLMPLRNRKTHSPENLRKIKRLSERLSK
jgi:hypothetical protein